MSLFHMPLDARIGLTERAWSVVADHPDPEVRFSVFQSHWVAIACPASLDRLQELLPRLIDLEEQIDFRHVPGAAVEEVVYAWAAEGDTYRSYLDQIRAADRPTRDIDLWRWSTMEAVLALAAGDVDEARRLADRSLLFGADVWNDSAHGVHGFLHIHAAHLAGEPLAARQLVKTLNARTGGPVFALIEAWLAAEEGDIGLARATLERLGPQRLRRLPEFFLGSAALIGASGAAIAAEDAEAMRALLDGFAPYSAQMASVPWSSYLAIGHHLGDLAAALGDHDRARAFYEEAVTVQEGFGAPAQVEITRRALAALAG